MHGGKIAIKQSFTLFNLSDFFMWLFMLFTYIVTLIDSSAILFQIRFVFLFAAGILGFYQLLRRDIRNRRITAFVVLCVISWLLSSLLRSGGYDPNLFLYSFLYMGMGVNMASHRHSDKYSEVLFYLVCGTILFRLLVLNHPIRGFLKDGVSYNFISVLVLLFLSYYSIERIQNEKPIPYLAAFLFAWISVLAYGRGGIVTGLFFLISVTILGNLDEINRNKKKVFCIITVLTVVLVLVFVIFLNRPTGNELFSKIFTKFYLKKDTEEPRLVIWSDYIRECCKSLLTIVFGTDPNIVFRDGNLHNAFLQMYSCFGLVPMLIMLFSFINLTFYSIKKKNYYFLCVLLTVSLRSMTDKTAFQGYCEPLFYYMVFSMLNIKEKKRMISDENDFLRQQ